MIQGFAMDIQFASLLALSLVGIVLGVMFDFLRSCGRILEISKKAYFFVDLLFCMAASVFVFYVLFQVNRGEVRFYAFFSLGLGLTIYFTFFSAFFYRIFCRGMAVLQVFFLKFMRKLVKLQDFFKKCRINRYNNHEDNNHQDR